MSLLPQRPMLGFQVQATTSGPSTCRRNHQTNENETPSFDPYTGRQKLRQDLRDRGENCVCLFVIGG